GRRNALRASQAVHATDVMFNLAVRHSYHRTYRPLVVFRTIFICIICILLYYFFKLERWGNNNMNGMSDVRLKKSTIESLKEYVNDFGMTVDDVVLNLIEENNSLKSLLGQGFSLPGGDKDTHSFKDYVIHKLPKGKILVTKDGLKVSNMKKVLIEAGSAVGMDDKELNPDFTTYEIGRFLFKHLQG
ncbi:hypothetical protein, partial [Klebsiella pneumoniae]